MKVHCQDIARLGGERFTNNNLDSRQSSLCVSKELTKNDIELFQTYAVFGSAAGNTVPAVIDTYKDGKDCRIQIQAVGLPAIANVRHAIP